MKEGRLEKIAQKETQKLYHLLKSGTLDPKFVSMEIFMEGVVEDYHIEKQYFEELEACLKDALNKKGIDL